MDGKTYPYLDLAALPAVGETLLDPRPAFVATADGARFLFANAAGAALLGAECVGDLLRHPISTLNPLKQQLARLARQLPTDRSRLEILRIGQGVALATLPAACRRVNLDRDRRAVLAVAATSGPTAEPLTTRAQRLVDALGANDCCAAVFTDGGKPVATSAGFDALSGNRVAVDALIDDARTSGEPLTRRPIGTRQSGIVQFRDHGRVFLLLVVGAPERARESAPPLFVEPNETLVEALFPAPEKETRAAEPAAESDEGPSEPAAAAAPEGAEATAPAGPLVQFVYEMDADERVTFVSPELAATVGEATGAIAGHAWAEIAAILGFGRPASGTVRWPADDGQTFAVDLTVMLTTNGGAITGYRGFGIIHPDDRAPDERKEQRALGAAPLASDATAPSAEDGAPEAVDETPDAEMPAPIDEADVDNAARQVVEGGHRPAERSVAEPPQENAPSPTNIVRLPGTSADAAPSGPLSEPEQDAFRRIAEALGARRGDAEAARPAAENDAGPFGEAKATARQASAKSASFEFDARLLDRLPVGIVIFRDRRTLHANRTLLDLLLYDSTTSFEEAGGAEAIFPWPGGLAGNIAEAGGRLAAFRRDGVRVPVKAWLHAVTFAGATALMLSVVANPQSGADEDELTEALARSAARAEELAAILDTATDGVLVLDRRGRIGSMNRAAEALFGVDGKDYAGRYFTDLIADESQKQALDYLDGLASNGVASVLNDGREVIGRVPAGGLIPLFMTMGRIGEEDKFCAVLRDITHWKNVEAEMIAARQTAEAANAQKSEFLAKISHEIRTPLNAIIGFSEMMMNERFGPIGNQRYRDYLRDINVSGAHLVSLINDLLDLSKIEAGKLDLSFQAVAVNATIQECVALLQPQANRERIIIRTSLSHDVPSVVADTRSLRQIILNLVSNAIKFTRAGGQVILSSSLETNGEVTVRVRDTGIGMNEKDLETALKPFRQVAAPGNARDHGTGLGLPLTKAMVEANRATLTIESAPDQGTLVKITFPTTRVLAG